MIRDDLRLDLERLHPQSFGWAVACCCGDRDAAQDVLQTAYLKAIEGRARFNGHSSPRTWFFGVVRFTAAEHRRRRSRRLLSLERWFTRAPGPESVPTPEDSSGDAELHQMLQQALRRLSARQRDLLHLVFYQELTVEESAEILGINVGTARTHYERGKAMLRRLLDTTGDRKDEAPRRGSRSAQPVSSRPTR